MIEIRRNEEHRTSVLKALLRSWVGFLLESVGGAAATTLRKSAL